MSVIPFALSYFLSSNLVRRFGLPTFAKVLEMVPVYTNLEMVCCVNLSMITFVL